MANYDIICNTISFCPSINTVNCDCLWESSRNDVKVRLLYRRHPIDRCPVDTSLLRTPVNNRVDRTFPLQRWPTYRECHPAIPVPFIVLFELFNSKRHNLTYFKRSAREIFMLHPDCVAHACRKKGEVEPAIITPSVPALSDFHFDTTHVEYLNSDDEDFSTTELSNNETMDQIEDSVELNSTNR